MSKELTVENILKALHEELVSCTDLAVEHKNDDMGLYWQGGANAISTVLLELGLVEPNE